MTVICGGGTSSQQVGFGATVAVNAAEIAAWLSTLPWGAPLAALAGYLALVTYDLSIFCTTDPPAMPSNAAIEAAMLDLVGDPISRQAGLLVIADVLGASLWPVFCKCDSGSPTPYTPPVLVSPIQVQPPIGGTIPVPLCWDVTTTWPNHYLDANINAAHKQLVVGYDPLVGDSMPTPPPAQVYFGVAVDAIGAHAASCAFNITWYNSAFGHLRDDSIGPVTPGTSHFLTVVPPVGAARWLVTFTYYALPGFVTPTNSATWTFRVWCDGQIPTNPVSPCCPPDPILSSQLQLILSAVELIQRQLAPFAYVHGAVHAGISGDGSIAVTGILGLKIELTTTPGRLGSVAGDPNTIFDAGWVNVGTADGFGPRQFLNSSPMVVLDVSPAVTVVGYSIPADVVVTITELVREP